MPGVLPSAGNFLVIDGLQGSSWQRELADLYRQHPGFYAVYLADSSEVAQAQRSLPFWLPDTPILTLPDWETLPYDAFSPHPDIIARRIATLHALPTMREAVLLLPLATLMQKLPPRQYIDHHALSLEVGQQVDPLEFRRRLNDAGYRSVNKVYQAGEFAARGALLDLYPSGSEAPIRIEWFDDTIETLRYFDPETQRTTTHTERLQLLPAHEFPTNDEALQDVRRRWRQMLPISNQPESVYQQISEGRIPQGIEYYLPLFFDGLEDLGAYLPENTLWIEVGDLAEAAERQWQEIEERFNGRLSSELRPPLPPHSMFLRTNELHELLRRFGRIRMQVGKSDHRHAVSRLYRPLPDLALEHRKSDPTEKLKSTLKGAAAPVLLTADSAGRREQLIEFLAENNLHAHKVDHWIAFLDLIAGGKNGLYLAIAELEDGFIAPEGWILISEENLYGERVRTRERKTRSIDPERIIRDLAELPVGALVVHYDYGVGRYCGLQTLEADGETQEFLTLEYANNDKLYVPVHALDQISRYSAQTDADAPLSKLGSDQWTRTRKKAAEQIRDVAAELLDVHARRAAQPGTAFVPDAQDMRLFAAQFPFEETEDQADAIHAVLRDLAKPHPMDRLICGDVGFGKTEVAMRAAFAVANCGHQVAVLVPTTLLAQQHYDNFRDRFADWPVKIELLSRFRSSKAQEQTLKRLEAGEIDIVIGTHKLVQKSIRFKALGLVIIDEEHRFGVHQKEQLKALQPNVDILAMTATPIPRTLNMALSGLRDLSIIATPPAKRLSVKTFVRPNDPLLVKDAIAREVRRGGQVYLVHNDIKTIEKRAEEIRRLHPGIQVAVAHGQMRELALERIMQEFYHHRYQVLVCTTIIETGIDIPAANTIIIDRADHFGLAQLHQLRGRVGRSHQQAYAYLLTPVSHKLMTADARRRLEAIEAMDELGSGFLLAQQDLEIRGAGEILGDEQSGQMESIGYSLYMDMLDRAVQALKAGREPTLETVLRQTCELDLKVPALLPQDFVPDVAERLSLYKRIAACTSRDTLDDLQVELIDRFGLLPQPAKNLFWLTAMKHKLQRLGVRRLVLGENGGEVLFAEQTRVEPMTLITLMQTRPDMYRMKGSHKLQLICHLETAEERMSFAERFVERLLAAGPECN
jgi:transcription-repair coupling factor (superfamily II helicase)